MNEPGAREMLIAYEADIRDPTALQKYKMDCRHRAPLRKLARYVKGAHQFAKIPVKKWSVEHDRLENHLQPRPIMALHLDNTIRQGHEPAHNTCALSKGTPLRVGLEDRTDILEPEPATTMVFLECPAQRGIRIRDAFMKRINGHDSDVASTVASKDPNNAFKWKCAPEHAAGQSGSHTWKLRIPM